MTGACFCEACNAARNQMRRRSDLLLVCSSHDACFVILSITTRGEVELTSGLDEGEGRKVGGGAEWRVILLALVLAAE